MPEEYSVRADRERLFMDRLIKWCDDKITYLKKAGIEFKDGFPILPQEAYYTDIPLTIESFQFRNKIPKELRKKSLICYFSPDIRLIQRMYKIDEELPILCEYGGICGFDLSPSVTMLRPRQKFSLLASALFNCYVAVHGVKILPNCRVGDLANMSVIRNIPPYTSIISGEIGCNRKGFKDYGLYQLRIIIKSIALPILFIYGGISNKDIKRVCGKTPQDFVVVPSARDKYYNHKESKVIVWDGISIRKTSLKDYIADGGVHYGG